MTMGKKVRLERETIGSISGPEMSELFLGNIGLLGVWPKWPRANFKFVVHFHHHHQKHVSALVV